MYKFVKSLSLLTPLILSVFLLIVVMYPTFKSSVEQPLPAEDILIQQDSYSLLHDEYTAATERLESKCNILLAIIGIAVTVWIGLSITNAVEKLQAKVNDLQAKITEVENMANNSVAKFG